MARGTKKRYWLFRWWLAVPLCALPGVVLLLAGFVLHDFFRPIPSPRFVIELASAKAVATQNPTTSLNLLSQAILSPIELKHRLDSINTTMQHSRSESHAETELNKLFGVYVDYYQIRKSMNNDERIASVNSMHAVLMHLLEITGPIGAELIDHLIVEHALLNGNMEEAFRECTQSNMLEWDDRVYWLRQMGARGRMEIAWHLTKHLCRETFNSVSSIGPEFHWPRMKPRF